MMKQTRNYILTFLLSLITLQTSAQDITVQKMDPDQFVFWISVRADIKISNETKKEVYVIRTSRKKPRSGTVRKYEKALFDALKSRQITIGPFMEYNDARRAAQMYNLARHTTESMQKDIQNYKDSTATSEYYWFFLKYKIMPRTRRLQLLRTAARVAFGDLKDFRQVLWEGIFFKQLAIGPFATQNEAEEAKRLYRLEED